MLTKKSNITYLALFTTFTTLVLIFFFWNIVFPFLLGVILAFLLNPILSFLTKNKVPKLLAICIILVFLVGIITLLVGFVLPAAISEFVLFLQKFFFYLRNNKELISNITTYLAKYNMSLTPDDITNFLFSKIESLLGNAFNLSISILKYLMSSLKIWILSFIALIYILYNKKSIIDSIMNIVPSDAKNSVISIHNSIILQIYQFIISLFIVGIVVFIFTIIFLEIFPDNPSPFLLALTCAILSMIPFLGGILPPIFVFLLQLINSTSFDTILWTSVGHLAFYIFIGLYLQPFMTGKKIKIHPLIILICIIVGGSLNGVMGVLLSVPMYITIRTIFTHFLEKYKKEEIDCVQ